jgi:MOSC domain-containing protein YiiM
MPRSRMTLVRQIFISPGHNFFGRYGKVADTHPAVEVEEVQCVTGMGLKGDRFFGYRPDYKGQVTFFSEEVWRQLQEHFKVHGHAPSVLRRNVILSGADLNALIGRRFSIQGVLFEATEECRPCHWMDNAVAPGAEEWLKGRGGLRCRVLSDGVLRREAA